MIAAALLAAALLVATPTPTDRIVATFGGGDSDQIALYNTPSTECGEGTSRATYTIITNPQHRGRVIEGCWVHAPDDMIYMAFADGDRGSLKPRSFSWVAGPKPMRL